MRSTATARRRWGDVELIEPEGFCFQAPGCLSKDTWKRIASRALQQSLMYNVQNVT